MLLVVAVALGAGGYLMARGDDGNGTGVALDDKGPPPEACTNTPPEVLQRVRRGFYPGRSGDVLAVERLPNQFGTRHSTPWPYTQDIPIVLYGPGYIKQGFTSVEDVTLADIAPTYAELLDFDGLGERDGRSLGEALLPPERRNGVPKLILTVVWDGGGINMLEQWPDSWPHLEALMEESASFSNATVGSSPSITPATHATLGTGDFPKSHGLTDIRMRVGGKLIDAWRGDSPANFEVKTLADLWDRANGNVPLIGTLARDYWHLGMMGHGSYLDGADQDIAVLDSLDSLEYASIAEYYTFPEYLDLDGLETAVQELDQRDGEADGEWLGNPLRMDHTIRETPAWSMLQTRRLFQLLETEGFGADDVPDLFFTNYKPTDLAGHTWNIVEPEVRDNLEEQDRQLELIVEGLNDLVGEANYVLALTADHGMTPYPEVTEGWPIDMDKLAKDLEERFNSDNQNKKLVTAARGYQFFLDSKIMRANGVTREDVAAFIRNYRLYENVANPKDVPERYRDRLGERLYLTAMSPAELRRPGCDN